MTFFADNDFVLKLAACDLIAETLDYLQVTRKDVRILYTAAKVFSSNRFIRKTYAPDAVERAIEFVSSCPTVSATPDPEEHRILTAIDRIDAGEIAIFCATKNRTDFLIGTGDINSLSAVAEAPTAASIHQRIKGKVVCVEQMLRAHLREQDFEALLPRLVAASYCDQTLREAFSAGKFTPSYRAKTVIANRLMSIQARTGDILAEDL